MKIYNKKETLALFLGDVFFFAIALWLTLFVRYMQVPGREILMTHLIPFSFLFAVWVVSFFIAGLYGKNTLLFKSRLPALLLRTQIINSGIAVLFFYFIPYFSITPKITLFLCLLFSFAFILIWRTRLSVFLGFRKKQNALLIGEGKEMRELFEEVNHNRRYALTFVSAIDLARVDEPEFEAKFLKILSSRNFPVIVVDMANKKMEILFPHLYRLIFSNVRFAEMHTLYEDIFDRVPLSLLHYRWFLKNISVSSHVAYDALKRMMDIIIALPLVVVLFLLYPFVWIAIKFDDGGPVFIVQERVGRDNKIIKILKFRSMKSSDAGIWVKEGDDRITRIGRFLRASRIDELPQLFSVIRGDMSLVGPRPDIYDLGMKLSKEIPYYTIRNIIKPGLSGWAQIKQENPPQSLEETKLRLAYDIYYIKHRSFLIDFKIALQTIATILSRAGK
ncbi:MAG: sugar transferase [Candidatus Parcubacteria bacterium]|nr:sugar transferase [Candidatus Parcubacteria bacterium]